MRRRPRDKSKGPTLAPRPHLDPALRDYVEGVFAEGVDALHAAVGGDHLNLRRIAARAADPELLAFVIAVQAGRALSLSGQATPLLADLADRLDNPNQETP